MAILCGISEAGMSLYDIPDNDLSNYQLKTRPLDEEGRNKLFPDKQQPSKDDAHGVVPVAASGGDVQGFGTNDICYVTDGYGDYVWWYC